MLFYVIVLHETRSSQKQKEKYSKTVGFKPNTSDWQISVLTSRLLKSLLDKVAVTLQRMSSAYADFFAFAVIRWCTSVARRELVARTFRARCHTHSYVGARSIRRDILCMHKNSLRMPTYGPYAASTLCTRYADVSRVRGAVDVRLRNVYSTLMLVDTKYVNFTTSPLRVGSEF